MKLKFFVSKTAHIEMERTPYFKEFLMESKTRFLKQDWGDMPDEDKAANNRAVVLGADIVAVYKMKGQPSKEIVIVVPYPRTCMQIMTKRELTIFKNKQRQFVIYGADGKPLSH